MLRSLISETRKKREQYSCRLSTVVLLFSEKQIDKNVSNFYLLPFSVICLVSFTIAFPLLIERSFVFISFINDLVQHLFLLPLLLFKAYCILAAWANTSVYTKTSIKQSNLNGKIATTFAAAQQFHNFLIIFKKWNLDTSKSKSTRWDR